MKRSSTPKHSFTLPFVYEKFAEKFVLTYSQRNSTVLEKTENDIGEGVVISGNLISVELTQEETKLFSQGKVVIQLKVWTKNKMALISDQIFITAENVLNDEVFE